jgi:hypothetical protein
MASSQTFTTTLTAPVGIDDTAIQVASAEGINNPGSLTAKNGTPSFIQIDQEYMQVTNDYVVGSLIVPVIRGTDMGSENASDAQCHLIGATVTIMTLDNYQFGPTP